MEQYIKPKYDSFDIRTDWNEGGNKWAKQLAVFIFNDLEKKRKLPFLTNKNTVGEEFYVIICSPQFHRSPNSEVTSEDIRKAIIMEEFDQKKIEEILRKNIDGIGEVSLPEFEKIFGEKFNMSDWYSEQE